MNKEKKNNNKTTNKANKTNKQTNKTKINKQITNNKNSIRDDFGDAEDSLIEIVKRPWMDMDFISFNISDLELKIKEIGTIFEELHVTIFMITKK